MPAELSSANKGGSVSLALLPFFVPRLGWLVLGCGCGFWAVWRWERCDGKIKAMPRRHAQVIVCTSFFRETGPRAVEIAFYESACNQCFIEATARQALQQAQISVGSARRDAQSWATAT